MTARETGWIVVPPPPEGRPVELQIARVHALATWERVVENDGSTVAYAPDRTTATLIAAVPDLLAAAEAASVALRCAADAPGEAGPRRAPVGDCACDFCRIARVLLAAVRLARGEARHVIPCGRCGARDEIVNKCGRRSAQGAHVLTHQK